MARWRNASERWLMAAALFMTAPCTMSQLPLIIESPTSCMSHDEWDCIRRRGCRWFSYDLNSSCELCDRWFGDQVNVTGCRDWDPVDYCANIFRSAQAKFGKNPMTEPFIAAMRRYGITQGTGDPGNPHRKRQVCNVWCDLSPPRKCFGQPRAVNELKGVNYGGRFIPEHYLETPGISDLYEGLSHPAMVSGSHVDHLSLCDVAAATDAAERVAAYLDLNIRHEHFDRMAALGFNTVRLPLGYWNLINLPGASGPNDIGDDTVSVKGTNISRWRGLQEVMSAEQYTKWIDDVFSFAKCAGMKVMLDLHGAPGGQQSDSFTGCNEGPGHFNFDTDWNTKLAVRAIEQMSKICKKYKETCFGIELLNEPAGCGGIGAPGPQMSREHLRDFYDAAIRAAREHVDWDKPMVIMDWTGWLRWWQEKNPFRYATHGRVMFSTHVYYNGPYLKSQKSSRKHFAEDIRKIADFYRNSMYDIMVSEYALNSHGAGGPHNDHFDYNSMVNWYVNQFNQHAVGSLIWNYDAAPWIHTWGAVAADRVGPSPIQWKDIFSGNPIKPLHFV